MGAASGTGLVEVLSYLEVRKLSRSTGLNLRILLDVALCNIGAWSPWKQESKWEGELEGNVPSFWGGAVELMASIKLGHRWESKCFSFHAVCTLRSKEF